MLRMLKNILLVGVLCLGTGCALKIQSYFEPVGKLSAGRLATPIVGTPDKIELYLRSSPDGFSLAENELSVEKGFEHAVLGLIRVGYGSGPCNVGNLGRQDLLNALQQKGYDVGANAVVYAHTEWTDGTKKHQRCTPGDMDPTYASGWAVIVSK
jgi:hypothetical protein